MPDYPFFLFFTITRPRLPEDVKLRHQISYLRLISPQELHDNTRCITRILAFLTLVGRKEKRGRGASRAGAQEAGRTDGSAAPEVCRGDRGVGMCLVVVRSPNIFGAF